MKRILASLLALFCVTGCAHLIHGRSPSVAFVETADGAVVRELEFVLTDAPIDTCLSGDWRKAVATTDTQGYTRRPAYIIEDGRLHLLLVNTLCDSYDQYIGEISGASFVGEHVSVGLGSSVKLGNVTGTYKGP